MKILCFTDNHFCESSSIIKRYGTKYSIRLENQLKSINWMEEQAIAHSCTAVCCLGDFFDKPELNEQEITALRDIKWNTLPHYFIVGNHESSINTLQYNSAKVLETSNHFIIDQPSKITFPGTACEICFLPYIIESDRKPLTEYFGQKSAEKRLILSHNDIKGIQMGPVQSKYGIEMAEIKDACNLFINGHLHNGKQFEQNALNLGNLTGKDFGENAEVYQHNILILDLDTLTYEMIENPYAFNFYKLEISTKTDLLKLKQLKANAVVSLKCKEELLADTKKLLNELTLSGKIIESRLIISKDPLQNEQEADISELTVDHLARFVECCRDKIVNTQILEDELAEICK